MGLKMNELSIRGTFLLIWVRFILLVCLFFYFGTFLFNFFLFCAPGNHFSFKKSILKKGTAGNYKH